LTAKIVKQRAGRAEESLPFEQTVLLLQGGGALGPYQAGVPCCQRG
jgi:predicted acylesterase/phospholipase RssA